MWSWFAEVCLLKRLDASLSDLLLCIMYTNNTVTTMYMIRMVLTLIG